MRFSTESGSQQGQPRCLFSLLWRGAAGSPVYLTTTGRDSLTDGMIGGIDEDADLVVDAGKEEEEEEEEEGDMIALSCCTVAASERETRTLFRDMYVVVAGESPSNAETLSAYSSAV